MKNTTRIITLVVAIGLIVGCILSVTASAVPTKIYGGAGVTADQYISEYTSTVVYKNNSMEESFAKPDYFKDSGTAKFIGEKVPGGEALRQGAKDIYDDTVHTNGILSLNYGKYADATPVPDTSAVDTVARPYGTVVFSSTTAPVNPLNGYIIEFDIGVHSYLDGKGTEETEDDEWLWEFPGAATQSGGVLPGSEKIWVEFLAGGSATTLNSLGQQLYSGTVLTVERISGEKAFNLRSNGKDYRVEGDTWVHLTWVFDAENWTFSTYIGDDLNGRELLSRIAVNYENYPCNFRIGGRCTFGQVSFDNVITYSGTKVHDPMFIERKSDPEKFIYFVDCIVDDSVSANGRYAAYTQAKKIYDNQPEIKNMAESDVLSAVAVYENVIQDEELIGSLEAVAAYSNSVEFYNRALAARSITRLLSNTANRVNAVSAIESFVKSCAGLLDNNCVEYSEAQKLINVLKLEADQDNYAVKFTSSMEKFAICEELGFSSSMRKHYDNASEYLNNTVLPDAYTDDNPADANSAYKRFVKAFADYQSAYAIITDVELRGNAARFVELVNILLEREDEWFTDGGACRNLWQKAREIIVSGRYDGDNTPGFANAYLIFTNLGGINDQFWNFIQEDHVKVLQEKLDGFNSKGITYIGRFAIITFIDHYITTNEDMIDPANTRVAEIYAISENYRKSLPLYEQDYLKMLEENANKFMDIIAVMKQMTTYAQIKPLFDQATDCYYGMDIPDEETMAAVAYYEELGDKLALMETDSVILEEAVADISAAKDKDALYAALVKGYTCLENVDATMEGVKEILDAFNAAYNEYMASIGAMNGELSSATDVVSSVRSYCGIDDLVDYASTIVE